MKILLVAERYWPEVGAAPSRLANMAEGLKAEGNEVDVLTGLPNYPKGKIFDGYRGCVSRKEEHNGARLFRYWMYATVSRNPLARIINMFSFAVIIWLFAFKRKTVRAYDMVIIQTPSLVVAASAMKLFKGVYGRRCVLNVSDIWPSTAVDMGAMKEGGYSYRFLRKCELFLYRKCDAVLGQSQEILDYVKDEMQRCGMETDSKRFLYRNLQHYALSYDHKKRNDKLKVVYSGLLGVAQDVAGIVQNVPFQQLGVEFHIFGGGNQLSEIEAWCASHPDSNVFTHGFVPKEQIAECLLKMDVGVIPLSTRIRGAVPSKLYDILPQGLPVLYAGGGEGAAFVESREIGYTCTPGDYAALTENITRMRDMDEEEYEQMSARCITVSRDELDFNKQMKECVNFLKFVVAGAEI